MSGERAKRQKITISVERFQRGGTVRQNLKALVESFYDQQKLRIMVGNRIVGNVRVRLGQEPGKPTEEIGPEGQQILRELEIAYRRVTDGMTNRGNRAVIKAVATSDGVITDAFEFALVANYVAALDSEGRLEKDIARLVQDFEIYAKFLDGVKGCGPLMSAVIIAELDPAKARHVSSFWRYAGLDVGPDGKGRSKHAEHLIDVAYTNKEGEAAVRKGITYNPFLKTKLMGVLAGSFLRCDSPYRAIYDGYKLRMESHPVYGEDSKGHRHNMAMRYMVKMFLRDLWIAWRNLEGLPVEPDYAEAKLGMVHGK
jgi:hypothetical protein